MASNSAGVLERMKAAVRRALLGSTVTREVPGVQVDDLLEQCLRKEITNELFDFGRYLLDQSNARDAAIDQKASSMVGYSSAILAFLLMRGLSWADSPIKLAAFILIGALAALACCFAALALRGARNWKELSEATWFPPQPEFIADEDQLKRFYITAMHQVHQENHRIVNRKADQMIVAQLAVAAAGVLLGCALFSEATWALFRNIYY